MKLCKICKERKAEIPDRNTYCGGRAKKEFCKSCHGELLKNDLKYIIALQTKEKGV